MTSVHCIGEPISWMRLERYVLGELPGPEAAAVRDHLDRCSLCRTCAGEAAAPRALPPLPPRATSAPSVSTDAARMGVVLPTARRSRQRLAIVASTLAIAAAIVLAVIPREAPISSTAHIDTRPRGVGNALVLVREHAGEITENPRVYGARDRFRVLVTCAPGDDDEVRVFVVQGGEASLALEGIEGFRCGNRVALEGAFRITGSGEARVCAAFGTVPPTSLDGGLARFLGAPGTETVCRTLRSEPEP